MRGDFVESIGLMVALARRGELECHSDYAGIHIILCGEEAGVLSLSDRPDVKRQLDGTRISVLLGDSREKFG